MKKALTALPAVVRSCRQGMEPGGSSDQSGQARPDHSISTTEGKLLSHLALTMRGCVPHHSMSTTEGRLLSHLALTMRGCVPLHSMSTTEGRLLSHLATLTMRGCVPLHSISTTESRLLSHLAALTMRGCVPHHSMSTTEGRLLSHLAVALTMRGCVPSPPRRGSWKCVLTACPPCGRQLTAALSRLPCTKGSQSDTALAVK